MKIFVDELIPGDVISIDGNILSAFVDLSKHKKGLFIIISNETFFHERYNETFRRLTFKKLDGTLIYVKNVARLSRIDVFLEKELIDEQNLRDRRFKTR